MDFSKVKGIVLPEGQIIFGGCDLQKLEVTENGVYEPNGFDGFSKVVVDVEDNNGGVFIRQVNLKLSENDRLDSIKVNNIKTAEGKIEGRTSFQSDTVNTYSLVQSAINARVGKTSVESTATANRAQKFSTKQVFKVQDRINASILLYKYYKLSDFDKKLSNYNGLTLSEMNFRKI